MYSLIHNIIYESWSRTAGIPIFEKLLLFTRNQIPHFDGITRYRHPRGSCSSPVMDQARGVNQTIWRGGGPHQGPPTSQPRGGLLAPSRRATNTSQMPFCTFWMNTKSYFCILPSSRAPILSACPPHPPSPRQFPSSYSLAKPPISYTYIYE